MTIAAQWSSRPAGSRVVVLVLAVLFGVLGMHALVAVGVPQSHASPGHHAGHHAMALNEAPGTATSDSCSHTPDDPDHLNHSDGTCAAAGLGSPYTPPALADSITEACSESELSARAPPDLSELQLLRI